MPRIVILGSAGSGKTYLARRLGDATGARIIVLDDIWQPEWSDKDVPQFRDVLRAAHAGEAWISDGNFALATFDLRLPRADLIVWLERPRLFCAWRAVTRALGRDSHHKRKDLAKVLRFIWSFERINRPRIEAERRRVAPSVPLVRLRSRREVEMFVRRQASGIRTGLTPDT